MKRILKYPYSCSVLSSRSLKMNSISYWDPSTIKPFCLCYTFKVFLWYVISTYTILKKKKTGKASKSGVQLSHYSSHLTGKSYLGFRSFWESEWNKFSPVLLYMFQSRSWKVNLYVHFVTNVFSENANPKKYFN